MKLSIITLTYNKLKYTKKYVESLFKYTKDFELIRQRMEELTE